MFKYIILITFHCFTQYYKNKNYVAQIAIGISIFFIFLRALYKKCGVEE